MLRLLCCAVIGVLVNTASASTPTMSAPVLIPQLPFTIQLPSGWKSLQRPKIASIVAWYGVNEKELYPNLNVFLYPRRYPVVAFMRQALEPLAQRDIARVWRMRIGEYPFLLTQTTWVHPKLGAFRAVRAAAMLDNGTLFITCVTKQSQPFQPCLDALKSLQQRDVKS